MQNEKKQPGIIKLIRFWIRKKNFNTAVKTARYLQAKTFKKHMVYLMNGRFVVIERQELKRLHREGRFKKGLNLREVEALSLYTTTL